MHNILSKNLWGKATFRKTAPNKFSNLTIIPAVIEMAFTPAIAAANRERDGSQLTDGDCLCLLEFNNKCINAF